ncbi:sugar transferase [Patescibacteria group bacterium]
MQINHKKTILFIGDIIILFFSLYLTLMMRYGGNFTQQTWQLHFKPFAILYCVWLLIFYITNLYDLTEAKVSIDFYQKLLSSLIICGFFSIAFFYLNSQIAIAPKTNLFLNLVTTAILFSIWRYFFNWIIKSTTKNNVIIVGYSDLAYNFSSTVNNNPQLGFKITAFVTFQEINKTDTKLSFISINENLEKFIKENNVNTVIINAKQNEESINKLASCLSMRVNFIDFTDFYEKIFSIVPINAINVSWFIENLTEGSKRIYDLFKRVIDIIMSIIIGLLSLPLIPFISIAIKINSKGSILFKQIRTGKNGKTFLAVKFRSMVDNAEKNGAEWSQENDNRITTVGKFLRKTRLDEIPQLLNVLRGEMSFVGPRPERPEFIEMLEKEVPFYKQRALVKPGLTGWAQANLAYGASKEYSMQKLQYDLYYIKHRSMFLDLKIVLKTVAIVFGFKGR